MCIGKRSEEININSSFKKLEGLGPHTCGRQLIYVSLSHQCLSVCLSPPPSSFSKTNKHTLR